MSTVRRFFALAFASLTPVERGELKSILIKLALGFVTATGLLTYFVVVPAVSKTTGVVPPETGGTTITTVAREPGVSYNVAAFCADPATAVGKTPMVDAIAGGNRYVALRATESVNWPDSPIGGNPSAVHYWHDDKGVQLQEAVEVTKQAADCLRGKAK